MWVYILLLGYLLWLIISFDFRGLNPQNSKKAYKHFRILHVVLVLVMGLAYRMGSDGIFYHELFELTPTLSHFEFSKIADYRYEPGWAALNVIVKSTIGDFVGVRIVCAISIYWALFELLKNHSKYPFTVILFFYFSGWLNLNFEMLRQTCAMAFMLWGCISLLQGDRKGYIFRCIPGLFFHWSIILVCVILLVFSYVRVSKVSIIICASTFFVGLYMQMFFGDLVNTLNLLSSVMGDRASNYLDNEGLGFINLNWKGFFIPFCTNTILPIIVLLYYQKHHENRYMGSILLVYLLFSSLVSSFAIANRFAEALQFFFFIAVSEMLYETYKRRRIILAGGTSMLLAVFLFMWTYPFLSDRHEDFAYDNKDVRYFPYTNVITQETITEREASCARADLYIFK